MAGGVDGKSSREATLLARPMDVALTGPIAAGKSTLGNLLSAVLGLPQRSIDDRAVSLLSRDDPKSTNPLSCIRRTKSWRRSPFTPSVPDIKNVVAKTP